MSGLRARVLLCDAVTCEVYVGPARARASVGDRRAARPLQFGAVRTATIAAITCDYCLPQLRGNASLRLLPVQIPFVLTCVTSIFGIWYYFFVCLVTR